MGYLGDVWGRKPALIVTNILTFIGALGAAVFTSVTHTHMHTHTHTHTQCARADTHTHMHTH